MANYSLRLPGMTDTPIATQPELLASTALPYIQYSGILKSGEGAVEIGDPIAWEASSGKFIKYAQGGSGDETTCVGFVRIPGDSTDEDVPIEVVYAGAVKYSLVSAATNWNAAVITDLKARYAVVGDALLFF